MLDKVLFYLPNRLVSTLECLSIDYHFSNIERGVIDTGTSLLCLSRYDRWRGTAVLGGGAGYDDRRPEKSQHAALVVVIILVNVISLKYFMRIDLTEDGIYTLRCEQAARQLARDKFLVKAYYTARHTGPYNNNRRYLRDQLDDYRAYADGNFQYEFVDPKSSEELEQEAQRYGIPPVQVQVLKEDKFQVDNAYMGLVFLYGDRQERIPVIRSTSNLEYEISSAIKKLTSKELRKVGFLTGQGEPDLEQF